MKKIKSIALLLVFAMLVSCFGFYSPKVFAADTGIKVQFFNSTRDPNSGTIGQSYKVFNTSSSPLDLSTVKLRYYYTEEGSQEQNFWCDYSGMMSGYLFINLTDKVTYKLVKMDKPVNGADSYIEIGFKDDAGSLEAGGNVVIQARTAKTDWSSYNQADDYSFNANSTDFADWDKVTGYVNGTLGSGVEPDGFIPTPTQKDSTIAPTSGTFDKNADKQADIPVTMTLNGNTLASIVNGDYTLVSGKDYTVADNVVTLSKSYLATLEKDKSYDLVFNFSAGKAATFTLKVVDTTAPTPVTETTLSVGAVSGKPGEKVVVPVTIANVPKDGLGACQFNVNYDPSVLEVTDVKAGSIVSNPDLNFAYKDFSDSKYLKVVIANLSLKAGTNAVSGDGDVMYITFTIKANAAEGKTPVTLSNAKLIETNETVLDTKTSDGSVTVTGTPVQKDSEIAPTSGTFDKNVDKQADVPVTMTLNGNTLVSIVNGDYTLVSGKDYTVADNVVTFSKSYLATLEKDKSYELVFNFSAGKAATFTLKVVDTTVQDPVTEATLSVGTASGKPGEKVVVPVTIANVPKDGLGACQFNVNYDPSVLEVTEVKAGSNVSNSDLNFAYKDFSDSKYLKVVIANLSLKAGTNAVSGDGDVIYITFTIKASAAAGTTPVTLSNAKLIETNETVIGTKTSDGSVTIAGTPVENNSEVAPTSGTFDKNVDKQADIPVTMTLNGNTLVSIVNGDYTLVADKDYTVSGDVVTLSKSYLATLEKDKSYDLVFNFSAGKAATFTLKVVDTTVQAPVTGTTLSVGTLSGKPGDKVIVPVKVAGLSSALGACQFNVNYDPSVLEVTDVEAGSKVSNPDLNFAYKNFSDSKYVKFIIANLSLKSGTNAVSGDGDVAYITFTIKANAAAGKTSLTLSNAKLIDLDEKVVTTTNADGSIAVVTE